MSVTRRAVPNGSADFAEGGAVAEGLSGGIRARVGGLARLAVTRVALLTILLAPLPALAAKYEAIVIDARTGAVLYEENADSSTYPASLTKMMTLYMTFDALDKGRLTLDQALPVSAHAQAQRPTKLGLRAGQRLKVEHAILGMVTKSANDAAVVLAEALGGSESRFAEMMTAKARELGMRHTVFRNANGWPNPEQRTTARDMAILARALISNHGRYYPYFSRRSFVYSGHVVPGHNHLMARYEGMDGIKTGYTVASGFNLASSAVRGGHRLVAVVLGGKTAASRDSRMAKLLDAAFAKVGRERDAPVIARADVIPDRRPDLAPDNGPDVSGEQAAVRPVVASVPVRPAAKPESITQLAAAVTGPTGADDSDGGWAVQVGAFSSHAAGARAVTQAVKQAPFLLRDAQRSVTKVTSGRTTMYRARLSGLEEDEARKVCRELKRHGHHCMPVSPNESL